MKKAVAVLTAGSSLLFSASASFSGSAYPTACYEPVTAPAVYANVAESVQVRPGRTEYDVLPARYGYETREVVIEEARATIEVIPAQYHTVARAVVLSPRQVIHRPSPPVYRTVVETVMVQPASERWEWRVIGGKRVYCRIAIPARYEQRTRTVTEPGPVVAEVIPAQYGTELVQVMLAPERTRQHVVPARTKMVRQRTLVEPERSVARHIPALYETRQRRVMVRGEHPGWRQVHVKSSGC